MMITAQAATTLTPTDRDERSMALENTRTNLESVGRCKGSDQEAPPESCTATADRHSDHVAPGHKK